MPLHNGHSTRWKFPGKRSKVHLLRLSTAGLVTRVRIPRALCGVWLDEWPRPTEDDVTCKTCNKLSYVQYSPSDVY